MPELRADDFDYELPSSLIAQHPPTQRDGGRLLMLGRDDGTVAHRWIRELPGLLPREALLVVNDSRVIPARLAARRHSGGRVELMLLEDLGDGVWAAMVRSSSRLRAGERLPLIVGERDVGEHAALLDSPVQGRCRLRLPSGALPRWGNVPLPPYIERAPDEQDRTRYQTVYAAVDGSVAAPTAGLHLSDALLLALHQAGVELARLTLHVGPGTFVPVRSERVDAHRMEAERYAIPEETAAQIAGARGAGRPVVAVGTTCVRALEASGGRAGSGRTELFIRPGYGFRVVDGLLTNFHLPRSTLLMLVCAFAGRDRVLGAYRQAVAEGYRFYSYGDAMLLL